MKITVEIDHEKHDGETISAFMALCRQLGYAAEPQRLMVSEYRASADPSDIRALGWAVAAHNDYRQNGQNYTFWLFTKLGRAVKGEGLSDGDALDLVRAGIRAIE